MICGVGWGRGDGVRLERAPAAAYGASALALPAAFLRLDSCVPPYSSRTYAADHGARLGGRHLKKMPRSSHFAVQYFSRTRHRIAASTVICIVLHQWTVRSAFAAAAFQGTGLTLPAQQQCSAASAVR